MANFTSESSHPARSRRANVRITRNDLTAMKSVADVKPDALTRVKNWAAGTVEETVGYFRELCQLNTVHEHRTCLFNGHVVRNNQWNGTSPVCDECGCDVTSAEQLRRTTPFDKVELRTNPKVQPDQFWVDSKMLKQHRNYVRIELSANR